MYRLALISDIHGNAVALTEVLAHIRQRGADQIVCLGDVATLGADPQRVIDILQDLGCACIRGNHEDYVLQPDLTDSHTGTGILLESIQWCREQLGTDAINFLRGFQDGVDLQIEDVDVMLYHGSPSSNMVDLLAETPDEEFDQLLGPDRAMVMAGGHTHLQMLRKHHGALVLNPGSVGAPFAAAPQGRHPKIQPHSEYALVEIDGSSISVHLHRVALDAAEMRRSALASTIPMREQIAAVYAKA